jgi:hypothetical protein
VAPPKLENNALQQASQIGQAPQTKHTHMVQPLHPSSLQRALQGLSKSLSADHQERKLMEPLSGNDVKLGGKNTLTTYSM